MIHVVLTAFVAARAADFRAERAEPDGELRAARHLTRGERANVGTTPIESDAFGHHLHVLFAEAFAGAVLARRRAGKAGIDAGLIRFVGHSGGWFQPW